MTTDDSNAPDGSAAELAELFFRLSKRIRHRSAEHLAPLGLTPAQARALRVLHHEKPMRIVALAGRLDIVPRSATTVVDALEQAGLVTRETDPADRRSVLVSLSAAGRERMRGLHASRRRAAEDAFGSLPESDRAALARILHALHGAINDPK